MKNQPPPQKKKENKSGHNISCLYFKAIEAQKLTLEITKYSHFLLQRKTLQMVFILKLQCCNYEMPYTRSQDSTIKEKHLCIKFSIFLSFYEIEKYLKLKLHKVPLLFKKKSLPNNIWFLLFFINKLFIYVYIMYIYFCHLRPQ